MEADIIFAIAIATALVLIVGHIAKVFRTLMLQRTVREAIRADSAATAALLEKIDDQQPAGGADDRNGLVLLAIGVAIFCFGLIQGDADDIRNMTGIALFPLLVGAALLVRFVLVRRRGAER